MAFRAGMDRAAFRNDPKTNFASLSFIPVRSRADLTRGLKRKSSASGFSLDVAAS
jgi:hypothetical protein